MPKIKQSFAGTVAFDARKKRSMLGVESFYAAGFLESREGHTENCHQLSPCCKWGGQGARNNSATTLQESMIVFPQLRQSTILLQAINALIIIIIQRQTRKACSRPTNTTPMTMTNRWRTIVGCWCWHMHQTPLQRRHISNNKTRSSMLLSLSMGLHESSCLNAYRHAKLAPQESSSSRLSRSLDKNGSLPSLCTHELLLPQESLSLPAKERIFDCSAIPLARSSITSYSTTLAAHSTPFLPLLINQFGSWCGWVVDQCFK